MHTISRNRILLAATFGALLATGFGASAERRQPREQDRPEQAEQQVRKQKQRSDARKDRRADRQRAAGIDRPLVGGQAPVRERAQPRQAQRERSQSLIGQRIAEQRIVEQRNRAERSDRADRGQAARHRDEDWRRHSQARERIERDRAQRLQQQRRVAQYRYQQDYYRRLRAQQSRMLVLRQGYNPYYRQPASYRYSYGGNWYSTSRYGADMLRQAVNRGYQEGLRAGRADRYDRWGGDYRDSFAWIDGSYGYDNYYVSRGDYQYYFRQGFQRGYEDGYYSRSRYGRYDDRNDTAIILGVVLASILNLQSIG